MDPRFTDFADQLTHYCCDVQKGEVGIIHAADNTPIDMISATIDSVNAAGGVIAGVWWDNERIARKVISQLTPQGERIHALGMMV